MITRPILLCLAVFSLTACVAGASKNPTIADQNSKSQTAATESTKLPDGFDANLAQQLGADDLGMRQYVFAMLKRGPNRAADPAERQRLQAAHMANIGRLAREGKLVLAGPFMEDGEWRGIYIFDVKTVEEARTLTETDPLIQSGGLVMELKPWYGSAALKALNDIHGKIAKQKL